MRETVGLILGVSAKEFTEGSETFERFSSRMTEMECRAMNQVGVLYQTLRRDSEMLSYASAILSEFQALLIGVQMIGSRMLRRHQTSFTSHFLQWQSRLQDHLTEMSSRRAAV